MASHQHQWSFMTTEKKKGPIGKQCIWSESFTAKCSICLDHPTWMNENLDEWEFGWLPLHRARCRCFKFSAIQTIRNDSNNKQPINVTAFSFSRPWKFAAAKNLGPVPSDLADERRIQWILLFIWITASSKGAFWYSPNSIHRIVFGRFSWHHRRKKNPLGTNEAPAISRMIFIDCSTYLQAPNPNFPFHFFRFSLPYSQRSSPDHFKRSALSMSWLFQ